MAAQESRIDSRKVIRDQPQGAAYLWPVTDIVSKLLKICHEAIVLGKRLNLGFAMLGLIPVVGTKLGTLMSKVSIGDDADLVRIIGRRVVDDTLIKEYCMARRYQHRLQVVYDLIHDRCKELRYTATAVCGHDAVAAGYDEEGAILYGEVTEGYPDIDASIAALIYQAHILVHAHAALWARAFDYKGAAHDFDIAAVGLYAAPAYASDLLVCRVAVALISREGAGKEALFILWVETVIEVYQLGYFLIIVEW